MFIALLIAIAKNTRNNLYTYLAKCLKKLWYIYALIYYKKNKVNVSKLTGRATKNTDT